MTDQTTAWPPGTRLLHVFGAIGPHDEVVIVGTRTALTELRDAIDRALISGRSVAGLTMTRDGEGYWPFVFCATAEQMEEVPLHYSDAIYGDTEAPLPQWIIGAAGDAVQEVLAI